MPDAYTRIKWREKAGPEVIAAYREKIVKFNEALNSIEGLPRTGLAKQSRNIFADAGSKTTFVNALSKAFNFITRKSPQIKKGFSVAEIKGFAETARTMSSEDFAVHMGVELKKSKFLLRIEGGINITPHETISLAVKKGIWKKEQLSGLKEIKERGFSIGKAYVDPRVGKYYQRAIKRELGQKEAAEYSPDEIVKTIIFHEAAELKNIQAGIASRRTSKFWNKLGGMPQHSLTLPQEELFLRSAGFKEIRELFEGMRVYTDPSFSGFDDVYNTIEGLRHEGLAPELRKLLTDFGSGWRGLWQFIKSPRASLLKRRQVEALKWGVRARGMLPVTRGLEYVPVREVEEVFGRGVQQFAPSRMHKVTGTVHEKMALPAYPRDKYERVMREIQYEQIFTAEELKAMPQEHWERWLAGEMGRGPKMPRVPIDLEALTGTGRSLNKPFNPIEAFGHSGISGGSRSGNSGFGSGWLRNIFKFIRGSNKRTGNWVITAGQLRGQTAESFMAGHKRFYGELRKQGAITRAEYRGTIRGFKKAARKGERYEPTSIDELVRRNPEIDFYKERSGFAADLEWGKTEAVAGAFAGMPGIGGGTLVGQARRSRAWSLKKLGKEDKLKDAAIDDMMQQMAAGGTGSVSIKQKLQIGHNSAVTGFWKSANKPGQGHIFKG